MSNAFCTHSNFISGDRYVYDVSTFFKKSCFKIVNIGDKRVTRREAFAEGVIFVGKNTFFSIKDKSLPKGDVLTLAEISGIFGAKCTSKLLALCHQVELSSVYFRILLRESDYSVVVYCFVSSESRTGVEMESLTGVTVAILCLYDLSKIVNKNLYVRGTRLLSKSGGKSGLWLNSCFYTKILTSVLYEGVCFMENIRTAVLTISDRVHSDNFVDSSGTILKTILRRAGSRITEYHVVPDVEKSITDCVKLLITKGNVDLIITTGGTGLAHRDVTVQSLKSVCEKTVPGIGEKLRFVGSMYTPFSWLSSSFSGICGKTLIIALPGSTNAVKECFDILRPILRHAIDLVKRN